MWFWKGSGRLVITLPDGRVIDSFATSLVADVDKGRVTLVTFNTVGPPMNSTALRAIMVSSIDNLRLRTGADRDNAVRDLDNWIAKTKAAGYVPAVNFGSRGGVPTVDVRVSQSGPPSEYDLVYSIDWFQ